MGKRVLCCMSNLQSFQYGAVLQELADLKVEVLLDRCQGQCVGCRRQPAAIIDGKWMSFDDPAQFRHYVVEC